MSIVSSSYVVGHAQADGRRYVTETHTPNVGEPVVVRYKAAVGADYDAIMAARVAKLNAMLANAEAEAVMRG
jgi:hypothetical protein